MPLSARALVFMALAMMGCDEFFEVRARVISCRSGAPVSGAEARLHLDKGLSEPDQAAKTDAEGRLRLFMNEPPDVLATLTITSPGFAPHSQQFRGKPAAGLTICLEPSGVERAIRP